MSADFLKDILEWNHRTVLGDLLAMETHIATGGEKAAWCVKKHKTHALEHGVREAISHSERLGLDSSKYREFYRKLEALPESPTLKEVVALREEWRAIIGDKTLKSECPVCREIGSEALEKVKRLSAELERKMEEAEEARVGRKLDTDLLVSALLTCALLAVFIFKR